MRRERKRPHTEPGTQQELSKWSRCYVLPPSGLMEQNKKLPIHCLRKQSGRRPGCFLEFREKLSSALEYFESISGRNTLSDVCSDRDVNTFAFWLRNNVGIMLKQPKILRGTIIFVPQEAVQTWDKKLALALQLTGQMTLGKSLNLCVLYP